MNKKANITITSIVLAILTVSLFITYVYNTAKTLEPDYDATGIDYDNLTKFDVTENITEAIRDASDEVEIATSDPTWFDFLSGIFNVLISPLKTIYRAYKNITGLIANSISIIQLPDYFAEYLITVIVFLIIIGIVMFRIYMKTRQ